MKKFKHLCLSLTALFLVNFAAAQVISISDARDLPEGSVVTVTGVLTNGPELGIIRYFQDGTGGLSAYGGATEGYQRGDSITVSGELKNYNGLLEIDPITDIENHGPAENPIMPQVFSLNQIGESTESILTKVETCIFAEGGNTFTGNVTYNITSNGIDGTIYVRNDHPLVGELIPVGSVDITAIGSQFTFTGFGGYQLLPRDIDDISSPNPINIISSIDIDNMSTTGFSLGWTTDISASTGVFFTSNIDGSGLTDNVEFEDQSVTNHNLELSGLEAGEVYFVQVYSVAGEDTARSNIFAAATVSNSSGTIMPYFNASVDNSLAEPVENLAITTDLRDTIVAYIDRAQSTLDIAVYNLNNPTIPTAINEALDRGVQIRYIAEGENANIGLANLDSAIPVLYRQNSEGSGMHNKFVIVDYASEDSSFVLTGSTNFTSNNLFTDANNLVVLQDKALAKAYTIEFNEMWGSSGSQPDEVNSRFGADKINNTPEKFIIGGKEVELYFSPSDGTTFALLNALETADISIDFALLLVTQNDLADKLIEKSDNFFVDVRGILNDVNISGSDFDVMVQNGVNVIENNSSTIVHHKYAIVDHANLSSDPLVITGSHNWSASAASVNDENTLVIHDASVANKYFQEFWARFTDLNVNVEDQMARDFSIYPNPASDRFKLVYQSEALSQNRLQISDMNGKLVFDARYRSHAGENSMEIDVQALPQGIYIISLSGEWGRLNEKLVVVK